MEAFKTPETQKVTVKDSEASVRNYPDFKKVEAGHPPWKEDAGFTITRTRNPTWTWGNGASDAGACLEKDHVVIDPQDESRTAMDNYKLLISGIIPRPIGFISTRSRTGESSNLAPMSYTQLVNYDPPIFVVGFEGGLERMKDTLRNLIETEECVINTVSEHFLEAVNAASVAAPYGISEWSLTGLTPARCEVVKASRLKESIFSIEGRLVDVIEFDSRKTPGKKGGAMAIIEGVRFWVREDAINEEKTLIDPAILRPMSRLGGLKFGRLTECVEILRPIYERDLSEEQLKKLARSKLDNQ